MSDEVNEAARTRFAAVAIVAAASLFNLAQAAGQGLLCHVGGWAIDAIPAALSNIVFDRPTDYLELTDVRRAFDAARTGSDCVSVDRAIAAASAIAPSAATNVLGNDDKGVIDFVTAAFRLFGLHAGGIAWAYLAGLSASALVFALAYPRLVLLPALLLIAHGLLLPFVAAYGQLTSFLALRFFPVFGMVAAFHLIAAALAPRRSMAAWAALAFQALIVAVAVHVRFAAVWLLLPVLAATGYALLRRPLPSALRTIVPATLVIAAVVSAGLWQRAAMADAYRDGEQIGGHVFWHSLLTGLAFDPVLGERWQLRLDDVSEIAATGRWLLAKGEQARWEAIGGTTPAFAGIRWSPYDAAAREVVIDICRKDPARCLADMVVYKPAALGWNVLWLLAFTSRPPNPDLQHADVRVQLDAAVARLGGLRRLPLPFGPVALIALAVLAAMVVALKMPVDWRTSSAILLLAGAASAVPSLVVFPVPHAVAEPAILALMAVHLAMLWLIVRLASGPRRGRYRRGSTASASR